MNRNDLYIQFRQHFQAFYDPLCKYAYTLVADHDTSEDIVQEVFVRIWEKHQSIIQSPQLRAYLYRAVRNTCFNHLGSQKRMPASSISNTDLEEEDTINWTVEEVPDEEIPNYRELLRKGIDQLPEKCKEIFLLSRTGNLSNQEIADKLGISVKTVNNQTWKAMKLLKAFVCKATGWLWPFVTYFFTKM
ncbi:RNA polymerase sigma-70 factor [Niastella caeni]|uniref:RNA polymerase sigma-70 factor n=1 Tax=Niastella caeni TaxID=2569763 RepID=UPI00140AEB83|nr:RNA polymerase sigma-70 factor [Niastella caeni]